MATIGWIVLLLLCVALAWGVLVVGMTEEKLGRIERDKDSSTNTTNEILRRLRYLENKERAEKLLAEALKWTSHCTEQYEYTSDAKIQSRNYGSLYISNNAYSYTFTTSTSTISYTPSVPLPIPGSWDLDIFEMDVIPKLIAEYHKNHCKKRRK